MRTGKPRWKISIWLHGVQLGDFHPDFIRVLDQIFPREGSRPGSRKLIVNTHRIVVVQQNKMIAHRQVEAIAQDLSVFDGTGNFPDIHDLVRAD